MTIHRREGEGGRGVNSAGMKKMKTGSYTILNYKVDEPGKGGKIHFFTTASRSDDGGGGIDVENIDQDERGRKGGYYNICSTLYILYGNIHNARQGLFLVYRLCIEYSSCINIQYISTGFHLFT